MSGCCSEHACVAEHASLGPLLLVLKAVQVTPGAPDNVISLLGTVDFSYGGEQTIGIQCQSRACSRRVELKYAITSRLGSHC